MKTITMGPKLYTVTTVRKASTGKLILHEMDKKVAAVSIAQARQKFVAMTGYCGEFTVSYYANLLP